MSTIVILTGAVCVTAQEPQEDLLRQFQFQATVLEKTDWVHWGDRKGIYSKWTSHSNRLIPVYSYGGSLESIKGANSCYRDEAKLKEIYLTDPVDTLNSSAEYFDQTDVYRLQKDAWKSGKRNIILMVFDGMDWNTTQAASIYKNGKVLYTEGRGTGLAFLDYKKGNSEFGFCVTSPHNGKTERDVNAQAVTDVTDQNGGGYNATFGGATPWSKSVDSTYLLGKRKNLPHPYTDSASSAVSLNAGVKTYNGSINFSVDGQKLDTLAHEMQRAGSSIGVVTSVPICHATPACVYAHNVERNDYQDISRDLLGLRSAAHRVDPLPGVDVLIGCGWGEFRDDERAGQGDNYVPGNRYIARNDIDRVDVANGGKYVVAQRTSGKSGLQVLRKGVESAISGGNRFFGFFGATRGHLPFQTADGNYDPTMGEAKVDVYRPEDIFENPKLSDMTTAALDLLSENENGFFLMVEAGDVDWANHNNNIDDSIGAVFSGDAAFEAITQWVEANSNWEETLLILTADHGHLMFLDDPRVLTGERLPLGPRDFVNRIEINRTEASENARVKEEGKKPVR
ncbi:MAG: alkaline phosphatase [Mariniblastus sp.]|nr:alkaline phosphatase [Mariniblastus sp.]